MLLGFQLEMFVQKARLFAARAFFVLYNQAVTSFFG
jgi:hypothetical protein